MCSNKTTMCAPLGLAVNLKVKSELSERPVLFKEQGFIKVWSSRHMFLEEHHSMEKKVDSCGPPVC